MREGQGTMIGEIKARVTELASANGNNFSACAYQVAKSMSDVEVMAFAEETENSRYISTAKRATTGINPRRRNLTEKERTECRGQ